MTTRFSLFRAMRPLRCAALLLFLSSVCATVRAEIVELRPALAEKDGVVRVEYRSGETLVGRSTDAAPAGVELLLPGAGAVPVQFRTRTEREGGFDLGLVKVGALSLRWRLVQKSPSLVERTLEVTADAAQRFSVTFPLDAAMEAVRSR